MICRICHKKETDKTSGICDWCGENYYYILHSWKFGKCGEIVYYDEKIPAKYAGKYKPYFQLNPNHQNY